MSLPAVRARLEHNRRHRKLFFGCEQLEDRKLMAIVAVVGPPGVLTLTGDGANDLAIIESSTPGTVEVDDGVGFGADTYVGINQIIFNGNGGDDELRIIQNNVTGPTTNNIFIPSGGIQFNGGAHGAGGDLLTMAGGTAATFGAGTYTPGAAGAGEVRYDILTSGTDFDLDFTGIELVNDTTTAGAFTAVQGAGPDTMVLEPGQFLPPVGGVKQGPVFLDGGDRDDVGHGSASGGVNLNGWKFIEQAMDFVVNNAINDPSNGGIATPNTLLVIGANGGQAFAAANSAATHAGGPGGHAVTFVNSVAAINTINFNLFSAIYIPSSEFAPGNNTGGGINNAQIAALAARKNDIGNFVRNGGGIATLTEIGSPGAMSFLELPLPFTMAATNNNTMFQTPALAAAGFNITNAELTAGTPVHNHWTGPAGFNGLDVFVTNGTGQIICIGQGDINTQIGGGDTIRISGNLTTMQVGQKTSLTGNTGGGDDSLTYNGATVSLDSIIIPVTLNAGLGIDTVNITDAADITGDTVAINHLQVTGLGSGPIPYSGAETLTVGITQGNDNINIDFTAAVTTTSAVISSFNGDDTFGTLPANRLRPSLVTTITLHGGAPVALPGDRLNLDMAATTAPIFVDTVGGQALSQSHKPVFWTSIETYDVIDDSGPIPNVDQGDLYVRTTPGLDYVVFSKGNGVSTRVRVNNGMYTFFPNNQIICYGREQDDYITASNVTLPVDFRGEDGNDYLTGGVSNDWLVGGNGNDRINGSHGDNILWGDNSPLPVDPQPQDALVGGDDILSGLGGADVFYGSGGHDQVSSGGGNDYAWGGAGNDVLDGNEGDDRLYGGAGNDRLSGFTGNDLLSAGGNDDLLYGQGGNDVLIGGTGIDLIDGGDGNDLLISGSVANESTSRTSVATTATFPAGNYSNPADNDAAMLIVLMMWGSSSNISGSLGAISHDGVNDDLFGSLGDDDFCWETPDVLDNPPGVAPPDFNAPGMGTDVRIPPNA
jgi:Ca2+-binding RTX toxin-like protein